MAKGKPKLLGIVFGRNFSGYTERHRDISLSSEQIAGLQGGGEG